MKCESNLYSSEKTALKNHGIQDLYLEIGIFYFDYDYGYYLIHTERKKTYLGSWYAIASPVVKVFRLSPDRPK